MSLDRPISGLVLGVHRPAKGANDDNGYAACWFRD